MAPEEILIREASDRQLGEPAVEEWIPPISALGGPPAHVLYHDLVVFAGLKLYKGPAGEPVVVFLDGENRRSFDCPSSEFVGALDRFRMRRGLRPSPAKDIDDLIRVMHARVTDPDASVPMLPVEPPEPARIRTEEFPTLAELPAEGERTEATLPPVEPWEPASILGLSLSFSGGFMRSPRKEPPLPHYIRVLHSLVRDGGWMGTTRELSDKLGEEEGKLAETLVRYRAELAEFGIVVANVQVEAGWRVLLVDRARIDDHS